jgi:hypothetical protein
MKEKEAAHYLEIWRAKNKTKQKKASTLNPKIEKKMLYFKYTFTTLQVLALPFFPNEIAYINTYTKFLVINFIFILFYVQTKKQNTKTISKNSNKNTARLIKKKFN